MKKLLWLFAVLSACNLTDYPSQQQQGGPVATTAMIAVANFTIYDITVFLDEEDKGIVPAGIFDGPILLEPSSRDYEDVPLGIHEIRGESGIVVWDPVEFELPAGGYPFKFE